MNKVAVALWVGLGVISSASGVAAPAADVYSQHFFYVGAIGGYGSDDWSSMIAQDSDTSVTNPTSVNGEGALFGADAGYQFNRHLAIEAEYVRMPTATIEMNYLYNNVFAPTTASELSFAAVAVKILAPIFNSHFTFFADAGPAYEYRKDSQQVVFTSNGAVSVGTWAPTFGGGFMYRMDQNWQAEASFQYLPGTGKSVGDPMNFFVPEIYAGTFKLDYLF